MKTAVLSIILAAFSVSFDPGLKVGQPAPKFSLVDQNGKARDFNSIKGPKGVALLFFRSADW